MDESGHSGDIGAAGSGEDADALDHSRVKGWAAPAAPQPHAASAFELASDVPAWLRPSTESYRIQRDQAFPTPSQFSERAVQHPFGAVSPTSVPPAVGRPATPPAPRPAPPGFVESTGGGSADPLPRNFAENPPSGDIAGLSPRARYADLPSAEYGPGRPTPTPIESSLSGARPVPLQTVDAPTPSSAPPYPYEGDLDDERRLNPPSSIGQQRAAVPLTRPGSLGGLAGQPAAEFAPEPARHALDSSGAPPGSPSRPPRGDSLTRSHSLSVTERASMLESLRPDPAARPRAPIAAETPARPEAVVSPDLSARLEASIRPHISAPQDVPVRPDGLVRPDVTGQLNGATSQPNSVAGPDRADRLTRPDELTRQKPYEPAPLVATPGYSPPAAYSGFSRPGASPDSPAPAVQIARVLPKRVPAQPDVPRVAEPPLVEPTAETPALARIATHLRRGDVRSGQEQQEGFDVQAILAAVREVAGVRDASLRATPAGAHSLRLDLAEGADPAEVSRRVARLLQERMGLDAALPGPGEPGRLGAADFASQPNLGPGGQPGSPVRGSARAAAAVPVSREQPIRAVPDPLSTPVHLLGQTTREITGETSRQIPGDRIPGETSRPIPSETSRRIPGETSRRIAGETSREISSGASHRVPGETSRRIPGETSRRIPGQIPSQGGGRPAVPRLRLAEPPHLCRPSRLRPDRSRLRPDRSRLRPDRSRGPWLRWKAPDRSCRDSQ